MRIRVVEIDGRRYVDVLEFVAWVGTVEAARKASRDGAAGIRAAKRLIVNQLLELEEAVDADS